MLQVAFQIGQMLPNKTHNPVEKLGGSVGYESEHHPLIFKDNNDN
jgi:hypothetical protein